MLVFEQDLLLQLCGFHLLEIYDLVFSNRLHGVYVLIDCVLDEVNFAKRTDTDDSFDLKVF